MPRARVTDDRPIAGCPRTGPRDTTGRYPFFGNNLCPQPVFPISERER